MPPKKLKEKEDASSAEETVKRNNRKNFPIHTLEETLILPQKIADEMGGRPIKKLLLADALGISPSSTNFRDLLSSSYKYGLTNGTEKAPEITLTELGEDATQTKQPAKRIRALRKAALVPVIFRKFFEDYSDKKMPSSDMLGKIAVAEYKVAVENVPDFTRTLLDNGRFVSIIRDISGSPHILLDSAPLEISADIEDKTNGQEQLDTEDLSQKEEAAQISPPSPIASVSTELPKAIFIGHGKNRAPLQKLQAMLSSFQIPHKITIDEANLGRPIPQKVKDTMLQCGSAILIFTRDEKFFDADGSELWRPSENVVHELGASSFAFGDRVVIFKEKGLHFPTNYQSIGYIEFEVNSIEARTADLLKELIGFGLVKITPM